MAVVGGDDGLGKGSLEEPGFLYPFLIKGRVDTFEVRLEFVEDVLFAHFEERVVHGTVVAEVDEVPAAIFRGRAVVGVLEEAGEGIAGVADVDPVAVGQLAIQGEDEALGSVCLSPVVAVAVVFG